MLYIYKLTNIYKFIEGKKDNDPSLSQYESP
jgi:hypothetical protein